MYKCFGAGSTHRSWSHLCHFIKLTSHWVMLFPGSALPGGEKRTKLKFRQNAIPKSWDNQDLLIHTLPGLQKIIFCLQFCSINLAILHEVCASRRLRNSRTSSACQCATETPFWVHRQGVVTGQGQEGFSYFLVVRHQPSPTSNWQDALS